MLEAVDNIFKVLKEKQNKTVKQEYFIWQNYPSKNEGAINIS